MMGTDDNRQRVLFICVHNSGRSQMAEAFLNALAGDRFIAESAGLKPTRIHPLVVEVMNEAGLDLSPNTADSVFECYKEGRLYDYVITVCRESVENQCPMFPGIARRLNWPFDNPEDFRGTHEEKLVQVRRVRDEIRKAIETWVGEAATART
jgi:arsenate reductase